MIPLISGDPTKEPASFSRFLLPFGYQPERLEAPPTDGGPVYRGFQVFAEDEERQAAHERSRYPTAETARVLFSRAKWWRLEHASPARGELGAGFTFEVPRRRGGVYTVNAAPPVLVLFEYKAARQRAAEEPKRSDLLATGFLMVDLFFSDANDPPDLEDLLELNELFRYWREPFVGHVERYKAQLGKLPVDPFRAPKTTVSQGDAKEIYTPRWTSLLERPLEQDPDTHLRLYPAEWSRDSVIWIDRPMADIDTGWAVYADFRTFVWTCALVDGGLAALEKPAERSRTHGRGQWLRRLLADLAGSASEDRSGQRGSRQRASDLGHWIKLLNVDRPGDTPETSTAYERERTGQVTYGRWEEKGTAYGFTYHSGALLAPPETEPPLWRHFAGMYFDQVLLLLYLRVTAFRFSRELSAITGDARHEEGAEWAEDWRHQFQDLRRDFVLFTNLYQFPLVSNQQQGIEMYAIARRALDVDELFQEVQQEVQSTHDYFQSETAQRLTEINTRLAVGAGVGLPFALATGFLGMNVLTSTAGNELLRFNSGLAAAGGFVVAVLVFLAVILSAMKWWPDRIIRWLLPKTKR